MIKLDWILFLPVVTLMLLGLITIYPMDSVTYGSLFFKQSIFILMGIVIMVVLSQFKHTYIKGPYFSLIAYAASIIVLVALLLFAPEVNSAKSWFFIGNFAVQPVEFVKLALILVFAKYFATRYVGIRNMRYVITSLVLLAVPFLLVFKQPDLGSSIILVAIWAGTIFVSGISKKHIVMIISLAVVVGFAGWPLLTEVQQDRVLSFVSPLDNLQSTGYNAHQSSIAIGSGHVLGKGIGEGTQSKLQFLPLYESDFVFAAYAEELGFIGVMFMFALFIVIFLRMLYYATYARTSFNTLVAVGVFTMIFAHFFLHIGVNLVVLPVTGITLSFVSYGGSHILVESIAIGILMGMSRDLLVTRRERFYRK